MKGTGATLRFDVVERNHISRAFVLEKLPVHFGHFFFRDEMKTQFVIRDGEFLAQQMTRNSAEQGNVQRTSALPILENQLGAHVGRSEGITSPPSHSGGAPHKPR